MVFRDNQALAFTFSTHLEELNRQPSNYKLASLHFRPPLAVRYSQAHAFESKCETTRQNLNNRQNVFTCAHKIHLISIWAEK